MGTGERLGRSTSRQKKFAREERSQDRFRVIPGWNRRVKQSHETAREDYLQWLRSGRVRNTLEFDNMRESRRIFKRDLKELVQCVDKEIYNKTKELRKLVWEKGLLQ